MALTALFCCGLDDVMLMIPVKTICNENASWFSFPECFRSRQMEVQALNLQSVKRYFLCWLRIQIHNHLHQTLLTQIPPHKPLPLYVRFGVWSIRTATAMTMIATRAKMPLITPRTTSAIWKETRDSFCYVFSLWGFHLKYLGICLFFLYCYTNCRTRSAQHPLGRWKS